MRIVSSPFLSLTILVFVLEIACKTAISRLLQRSYMSIGGVAPWMQLSAGELRFAQSPSRELAAVASDSAGGEA
jgi:hypothetical protein